MDGWMGEEERKGKGRKEEESRVEEKKREEKRIEGKFDNFFPAIASTLFFFFDRLFIYSSLSFLYINF